MSNSNLHINYQRGLVPLLILSLLNRKDMYGYQLVQETKRVSHGKIVTQQESIGRYRFN